MATVITFKKSSTQNAVPTTSDIVVGELALNTYHGRVYTEKNDGSAAIVEVGSVPASLTINDAITFPTSDGTSGQVLQTDGSGSLSFADSASAGDNLFTFTVSSNTTAFSGNDDDGQTLSYSIGDEQVYLNGVLLVDGGADYTTTSTSVITLSANAVSGDTLVVRTPSSAASSASTGSSSFSATTANQSLIVVPTSTKAIKVNLVATHASAGNHFAEVVLVNDGSDSFISQFADTFTNASLFSLSTDISGSDMRLLITPVNTDTSVSSSYIKLPAQGNSTTFSATTADQVLSSVSTGVKGIKYELVATHASAGSHYAEVTLTNDGSDAYFVQFGDVFTNASLFTLSADVSGSSQRLLITPVNTNTTVSVKKTTL
jgi:hypothetical protein|tara:strand:- start:2001 stop:3122 length:1122 start_codon:yes stop_codon:yes gene_type:complete